MEAQTTLFYVVDGGPARHYPTMAEAKADADLQIDLCREACDPEWPWETNDIAVYACTAETASPDEDGRLVLIATHFDIPNPHDGDEVYWEYEMRRPGDLPEADFLALARAL